MKTNKKLLSMLLALVMVLGVFAPVLAAEPAERQTTVVIHKLLMDGFEGYTEPEGYKGQEITIPNAKEIFGVAFDIYKQYDDPQTGELTDTSILGDQYVDGKHYVKVGDTIVDNTKSKAVEVTLGEGTFVIVENKEASVYEPTDGKLLSGSKAIPTTIILPMTNPTGTGYFSETEKLHIYPKNTEEGPTVEKSVDELNNKYNSHQVGDVFPWVIEVDVPENLKEYTKFEILDNLDAKLTYKGNLKVVYGNFANVKAIQDATDVVSTDYYTLEQPTADAKGGKLELKLTDAGRQNLFIKADPANKLYIYFETIINEDAIMGLEIPNDVTLTFNNTTDTNKDKTSTPPEKPKVITGGKKFIKVDQANNDTKLENAIFQLLDGDAAVKWTDGLKAANADAINAGKFAIKQTDGSFKTATADDIVAVDGAYPDIYLRSAADGTFEIKGLEFSSWTKQTWNPDTKALEDGDTVTHTWKIKEVQAPAGYNIPTNDTTEFTVDKNSYYNQPTQENLVDADPLAIPNQTLTIPPTGGMGTILFVIIGVALMGGALIAMKKRNESEQF